MSISPVDLVKRGDNGVASVALFQLKRDVRDDDELLADYGKMYENVREFRGYSLNTADAGSPPSLEASPLDVSPLTRAEEDQLPYKVVAAFGLDVLQQLMPYAAVHDDELEQQERKCGKESRYAKNNVTELCQKEYGGVEHGDLGGVGGGVGGTAPAAGVDAHLAGTPALAAQGAHLAGGSVLAAAAADAQVRRPGLRLRRPLDAMDARPLDARRPLDACSGRGSTSSHSTTDQAISSQAAPPVQLSSEGRPAQGDIYQFTDEDSQQTIEFTRRQARKPDATASMVQYNQAVAAAIAPGVPATSLVECSDTTDVRRAASRDVAALLTADGYSWQQPLLDKVGCTELAWKPRKTKGLLLCVGEEEIQGYGTYPLNEVETHNQLSQKKNTLMIGPKALQALRRVRDELLQQAGHEDCARLVLHPPEGLGLLPRFVAGLVFLVDEASQGAGAADLTHIHLVNSASEHTRFSWHTDTHEGIDEHTEIKQSSITQLSPGSSSVHIAGLGEFAYTEEGGCVRFPSGLLHRTGPTVVADGQRFLWKLAVFHKGPYVLPSRRAAGRVQGREQAVAQH